MKFFWKLLIIGWEESDSHYKRLVKFGKWHVPEFAFKAKYINIKKNVIKLINF